MHLTMTAVKQDILRTVAPADIGLQPKSIQNASHCPLDPYRSTDAGEVRQTTENCTIEAVKSQKHWSAIVFVLMRRGCHAPNGLTQNPRHHMEKRFHLNTRMSSTIREKSRNDEPLK